MHFIHDKFCLKNLVSCFSNSVIIWTTFMAQRTLNIKCTHNIINELIRKLVLHLEHTEHIVHKARPRIQSEGRRPDPYISRQ